MDARELSLYALWAVVLLNLAITLRLLACLLPIVKMRRAGPRGARTELRVGSIAPAFRAVTLTGEGVTERTYAGRLVAFVFVSPGCGGCRTLLPMVQTVGAAADGDPPHAATGCPFQAWSVAEMLRGRRIVERAG